MAAEELKRELDQMADEFCQKNHVGRITETDAYKDFVAAMEEAQRHTEEQKARSRPRQMLNVNDVMEILGVSKSQGYKIIKRLNNELERDGYITVRGRISKAFFEKRTYGVDVDER